MTYEENVRKVAEEMVKNSDKGWETHSEGLMNIRISIFDSAARIAVRLQAEAFKDGYITAIGHISDGFTLDYTSTQIKRGLIPAREVNKGDIEGHYCHDFRYGAETCVANKCPSQCDECKNINSPSNSQE